MDLNAEAHEVYEDFPDRYVYAYAQGHSYYDTAIWVVDIPARDWEECSACGTVK